MKVHELNLKASPKRKRVGRGIGSGKGKTAGRGTKGQWARSGGGVRPGFEGGQNPLSRRLPKKRGFAAINHTQYQVVNLDDLERVKGATIDPQALVAAGLIRDNQPVKLLGDGKLTKKVTVKVHAASRSAASAIAKADGKLELIKTAKAEPKPTK